MQKNSSGKPRKTKRFIDANDTATDSETAQKNRESFQIAGYEGMPAKARRLHPRLYDYPEKAEFGSA